MSEITVTDSRLKPVADKLLRGEPLTRDDALAVYQSTDLLGIGELANYVRERRHGARAWCRLDLNPPPVMAGSDGARISQLLAIGAAEVFEVPLRPRLTGHAYLKDVAVARLMLPQTEHIQARLCAAVENVCQLALRFGADTLVGADLAEVERQAKACGRTVER